MLGTSLAPAGEHWPGWRGPTGMGQCDERNLPLVWGGKEQKNVLWKASLFDQPDKIRRDQNQSSPIVWGDRVFVTVSYWPPGVAPTEFPGRGERTHLRKGQPLPFLHWHSVIRTM